MSKATEENKYKVTIKRLFENSIYIGNLGVQTKVIIRTKTNSPFPPFYFSCSFLNCRKTAKSMTLRFSGFQFVFINVRWKFQPNYMSGLFCIVNLLEMGRKKYFILYI